MREHLRGKFLETLAMEIERHPQELILVHDMSIIRTFINGEPADPSSAKKIINQVHRYRIARVPQRPNVSNRNLDFLTIDTPFYLAQKNIARPVVLYGQLQFQASDETILIGNQPVLDWADRSAYNSAIFESLTKAMSAYESSLNNGSGR